MRLNVIQYKVTEDVIIEFKNQLQKEDKSDLTIQKYVRDIRRFQLYLSRYPRTLLHREVHRLQRCPAR